MAGEAARTKGPAEYVERIVHYIEKALHEAKLHTSWLNPNRNMTRPWRVSSATILAGFDSPFIERPRRFRRLDRRRRILQFAGADAGQDVRPGVPDFYQGVEFWDFNLVDPDNRRPVDFAARGEALVGSSRVAKEDLPGWPTSFWRVGPTSD